jgi:uncharacterized protein (DUF1697 family)
VATRLVVLLRGINVGRNKRIAMADLRALLTSLGYADVATLSQSGNVVLTSTAAAATVPGTIERALVAELGVRCKVITRTHAEVRRILEHDPIPEGAADGSRYLVAFCSAPPQPSGVHAVEALDLAPGQMRMAGREFYLWCPGGLLASPISKLNLDRVLGIDVTMRNWNTVTRLAGMASG